MRDEFLFKLGQSVRYLRLKKGISQEELAFNAGLNLNSISTFERGINNIKIKNLYKIAQALDVGLDEIINCKF
ncbi:MAG: helix-turn-helix domain-containing protein [Brachyspira sp.]|nr:helix-turn-helix domain-containing protein [Brachyspira sp.]